jgi:hypothetical protein
MLEKAAGLLGLLIGIMFWTAASADAYLSNDQYPPDRIDIDISGEISQRDLVFSWSHS